LISASLTAACLFYAESHDLSRLITFANYSGLPEGGAVWPRTESLLWLFALGFILPAYTITGFDASAHTSEETVGAAHNVPRGIVRSVLISGICGWVMLSSFVLAMPDLEQAAAAGDRVFFWTIGTVFPGWLALAFYVGIAVAQYMCGLATVTSASRMVFAFARDEGLLFSATLRRVSPRFRTPACAIWAVSFGSVLFTVYTPVYSTITTVCTIFLYISYILPTALGVLAQGRTWTRFGPWHIGACYRPLAIISVLGCGLLIAIGMAPPNDKALGITGLTVVGLIGIWFGFERQRFAGPPPGILGEPPRPPAQPDVAIPDGDFAAEAADCRMEEDAADRRS
jgi:amino acid transporter